MFTADAMRSLLSAKPFIPFRLWLSDGGHVDVPTREVVIVGRQFAVIGLLDRDVTDTAVDRYTTVWYLHVTRHEMVTAGIPPFTRPPDSSETPSPAPVP